MNRKLSQAELLFHRIDSIATINFVTFVKLQRNEFSESRLIDALRSVESDTPMMRSLLASRDLEYSFECESELLAQVEIYDVESEKVSDIINREVAVPFKGGDQRLYRCLCIRSNDHVVIALVFSHMLADGLSAYVILN